MYNNDRNSLKIGAMSLWYFFSKFIFMEKWNSVFIYRQSLLHPLSLGVIFSRTYTWYLCEVSSGARTVFSQPFFVEGDLCPQACLFGVGCCLGHGISHMMSRLPGKHGLHAAECEGISDSCETRKILSRLHFTVEQEIGREVILVMSKRN